MAEATLELLGDPAEWQRARESGIRRVEKYYAQHIMFDRYRSLYDKNFAWQA
jgi:hypothetical protein